MSKMKIYYLVLFMLICSQVSFANNISIANVSLTSKNTSAGADNAANFRFVQFDISWENSWRTSSAPNNWDAAWVFMKYRLNGIGDWKHANFNPGAGQTAPAGGVIDVPTDGVGAFIYRSANGSGTFSLNAAQLRWNYGFNNVLDNDVVEIKLFAIEMVYVPQGSFYLGSGGTETGSFTNGSWVSGNTIPYQITSENAINISNTAGNLWGTGTGTSAIGDPSTIAVTYPKGFAAFYCMKYEISQGQFRDFLNSLNYTQQLSLLPKAPNSLVKTGAFNTSITSRNALMIKTQGAANTIPAVYGCNLNNNSIFDETTDGEGIACNFLSWMAGAAYMDWSGLRPMTELEFEKACRGTQTAVANEYVWGNSTVNSETNVANLGDINEIPITSNSNTIYNNTSSLGGPIRVGAFANSSSDRTKSGSTFYGIMNMGDNVYESIVTVGNSAGRSFTGLHGNGSLLINGKADVDYWPGINGNSTITNSNTVSDGVTGIPNSNAAGTGLRGGNYNNTSTSYLQTSYRMYAAYTIPSGTSASIGIRGVRSAQ